MTRRKIDVQQAVMAADLGYARKIRDRMAEQGILMVNMIGSPGAGKTALLERTLTGIDLKCAVIEGDIATDRDAARIKATGVPCVQINTNGGCHLEANWIDSTLDELPLEGLDVLFIENVGNLVCPAEFDLGEDYKVAISSVPEGADKPLKYPLLFSEAAATVLTKIDLIPYVDFDEILYWDDVTRLNPRGRRLRVSSVSGEGLEFWLKLLYEWSAKKRGKNNAGA